MSQIVIGNYDQTGLASWVADENQGLPTASGELYDPSRFTASHRTLPLGSVIAVTNLENGRVVEVRINDRGPFKKERVVDLSRAAAQALGMIDKGVVQVGLTVRDKPAQMETPAPVEGAYYVQVGGLFQQGGRRRGAGPVGQGRLRAVHGSCFPQARPSTGSRPGPSRMRPRPGPPWTSCASSSRTAT